MSDMIMEITDTEYFNLIAERNNLREELTTEKQKVEILEEKLFHWEQNYVLRGEVQDKCVDVAKLAIQMSESRNTDLEDELSAERKKREEAEDYCNRVADSAMVWVERCQDAEAQIESLTEVLKSLLTYAEINTCLHEETYRGGTIWEICSMCGKKWADDEGGKPEDAHEFPKAIANAQNILTNLPKKSEEIRKVLKADELLNQIDKLINEKDL